MPWWRRQYSSHHSGVCTWRSANFDTSCRGDVSSAVFTTSRVAVLVALPNHRAHWQDTGVVPPP